jgi:hypothetical protein
VRLIYTATDPAGTRTEYDYTIPLQETGQPGRKPVYWLTCPSCGRRAGTLYMPPMAQRFACRKCHDLTYTSCQESHKWDSLAPKLGLTLDEWRRYNRMLNWRP